MSTKDMFDKITNVFQRHTIFNKFRAGQDFYTAELKPAKMLLSDINRIQQMGYVLK